MSLRVWRVLWFIRRTNWVRSPTSSYYGWVNWKRAKMHFVKSIRWTAARISANRSDLFWRNMRWSKSNGTKEKSLDVFGAIAWRTTGKTSVCMCEWMSPQCIRRTPKSQACAFDLMDSALNEIVLCSVLSCWNFSLPRVRQQTGCANVCVSRDEHQFVLCIEMKLVDAER